MATVSSRLRYSAPLTPTSPADGWVIDALSQPPKIIRNFRTTAVDVTITDLRDGGLRPTLDGTGFERVEAATRVDQRALAESSPPALALYQAETVELLRSRTGAERVVIFDATVRREDTEATNGGPNQSAHQRVHVDQSPNSARARAANHGEPGRPFSRFQIVNVWRPLLEPVRNYPLALCDYRSLDPATDLVPTRLHFPAWLKDRENYSVRFNPRHRWYHWGALSPDEALMFKCHDSASGGPPAAGEGVERPGLSDVAALCPHTAFVDPDGPTTGRLRTSLELRALLFYS